MKTLKLFTLLIIISSINGFAQEMFPVNYRVEKQSMSTPMTSFEEMFFGRSYYTKPVNVNFDGEQLKMAYDNGATFINKNVTKVDNTADIYDGELVLETLIYIDNENKSDTILFIVDYEVAYLQVVLTTKNSSGENIGYTSFRTFVSPEDLPFKNERQAALIEDEELALN